MDEHFEKLQRMYHNAPVNARHSLRIELEHGRATISSTIDPNDFHAAQALHGSQLFKLLDDAAFFAVQTALHDHFIVTTSFDVRLCRPVNKGTLIAKGTLVSKGKEVLFGKAEVRDDRQRLIAFGSGQFARSAMELSAVDVYR